GAGASFELKTLPGGFGGGVTGPLGRAADHVPPWEMGLSGLLGLYPTVMLLTLFLGPLPSPMGPGAAGPVRHPRCVGLFQCAVMPMLEAVIGPWLRPSRPRGGALTIGGTVLILGQLVGLMLIFRAVAG